MNFNDNVDWIANLIGLSELQDQSKLFIFIKKENKKERQKFSLISKEQLLTFVNEYNGKTRISITSSEFPIDCKYKNMEYVTRLNNILIDLDFDNNSISDEERLQIFQTVINPLDLKLKEYDIYAYYHFSGNKGLHAIIPVRINITNQNRENILDVLRRFRKYIQIYFLKDSVVKMDNVNPLSALIPIPFTIHPDTGNIVKPIEKFLNGYDYYLGPDIYKENWKAINQLVRIIPKTTFLDGTVVLKEINKQENPEQFKQILLQIIQPFFIEHYRNMLTYGLSGILRKNGFEEKFVIELFTPFMKHDNKSELTDIIKRIYKEHRINRLPGYNYLKEHIEVDGTKLANKLYTLFNKTDPLEVKVNKAWRPALRPKKIT